jgi:DNA-binding LytR/AlgR family response regulator
MNHNNSAYKNLLEVNTVSGKCFINLKSIIYVEANDKCSNIYLVDDRIIITRYLLKDFEGFLSEEEFFRCHKSYIVNYMFVEFFCSNVIILKGNRRISLSRSRKLTFIENLKSFRENELVRITCLLWLCIGFMSDTLILT